MTSILEHFKDLPDPRMERRKLHQLSDIIFITIAAVICGADDWEDIEDYGNIKYEWLRSILKLPNGIPSHDTFNRVFSLLDSAALQKCFVSWVQSVCEMTEGRLLSLDGKRMCQSGEKGSKAMIHMVSAWSNSNNMVLAQQKVNDKSNEITAIPALLDILSVKGCLISIDAMGCQKEIAAKIISREADYLLAVKGNQDYLEDDIKEAFREGGITASHVQSGLSHGRIEKRTCSVITDTDWVCKKEGWVGLKSLVRIESSRTFKATGKSETHTRYYISSAAMDAKGFNEAARGHWGVENKLHWILDVSFNEDASTKRAGQAAENFSFITKIALNLLNQYEDKKGAKKKSIKTKRKKSGWDNDYLLKIMIGIHKF